MKEKLEKIGGEICDYMFLSLPFIGLGFCLILIGFAILLGKGFIELL